jgi:flagellar M-ring protein FliF
VASIDADHPPALELNEAQKAGAIREIERRKVGLEYAQQTATQDPLLVASLIQHWMKTP